jgi:predicted RNase H-like nuclease (RuvC/YqgF family)
MDEEKKKTGLQRQTKAQLIEIILRKDSIESNMATEIKSLKNELESTKALVEAEVDKACTEVTTKLNTAFHKDMAGNNKKIMELKYNLADCEDKVDMLTKKLRRAKELALLLATTSVVLGVLLCL